MLLRSQAPSAFTSQVVPGVEWRAKEYLEKHIDRFDAVASLLASSVLALAGLTLMVFAPDRQTSFLMGTFMFVLGIGFTVAKAMQYRASEVWHRTFTVQISDETAVYHWSRKGNVLWRLTHEDEEYVFSFFPQREIEAIVSKTTDPFTAAILVSELQDFMLLDVRRTTPDYLMDRVAA